MEGQELPLLQQYQAWISPAADVEDPEREMFFTSALVVLDTNALLDLYEYTPPSREEVFRALEKISPRMWLPHQVGLEFVRNRHSRVHSHTRALKDAPHQIERKIREAIGSVIDARNLVQHMLATYSRDTEAQKSLDDAINAQTLGEKFDECKSLLLSHAKSIKDSQDLTVGTLRNGDDILTRVASLFGDRIGTPPQPQELRQRVEEAFLYRFPNEIPPGFADEKGTPLRNAGDFLFWEEIIQHASTLTEPRRVLLVSADTKEDWYQPAEQGNGKRPWPWLFDEMRLRSNAELRIEQPQDFFEGIQRFLDADITKETSEEIKRAAESPDFADRSGYPQAVITEREAATATPPSDLGFMAYDAAGLTSSVLRRVMESSTHRLFQWWLIGVTVDLGRRPAEENEPFIEILAAIRSRTQPRTGWIQGTALREGELPYRSSTWLAPWYMEVVQSTPQHDRLILQRLAVRQADTHAD